MLLGSDLPFHVKLLAVTSGYICNHQGSFLSCVTWIGLSFKLFLEVQTFKMSYVQLLKLKFLAILAIGELVTIICKSELILNLTLLRFQNCNVIYNKDLYSTSIKWIVWNFCDLTQKKFVKCQFWTVSVFRIYLE